MNSDSRYQEAIMTLDFLLAALAAEQATALSRRDTMATDDDLASVVSELRRRRQELVERRLAPVHLRYRTLTRQVTDSWRLGSKLGNEIAKFEAMLEKLK